MPGMAACGDSVSGSGRKRVGAEAQATSSAAITAAIASRLTLCNSAVPRRCGVWTCGQVIDGAHFGPMHALRSLGPRLLEYGQQLVARPVDTVIDDAIGGFGEFLCRQHRLPG